MAAEFTFDVDPVHSFVRITMAGFFDAGDIARFSASQDDAYRQLRCAPNQHVTLVDMRHMHIQAQDSVKGFQARLSDSRVSARRIAFVVSRSLARLQIKRAVSSLDAAIFTDDDEAMRWLHEYNRAA